MEISLSEMKQKNKERDGHFFDKGNPKVLAKYGRFLVTTGFGGGFIIYKFEDDGRINLVDNPSGEYSWQPYKTRSEAVLNAKKFSKEE